MKSYPLKNSSSTLILIFVAFLPRLAAEDQREACPRPAIGSTIPELPNFHSAASTLKIDFSFRTSVDVFGLTRYCYISQNEAQAPTVRIKPGDTLVLTLRNDLPSNDLSNNALPSEVSNPRAGKDHIHEDMQSENGKNDCAGGAMSAASTNLHFHGLNIPPKCHQDEVIRTLIQPGGESFEYRFTMPLNQPPGLYWYHPHPHGFSEGQVIGGASGALIVEGIEKAKPQVVGLPERVLVLRDQLIPGTNLGGDDDSGNGPAKDISLNFVPVMYPLYRPAQIEVQPARREFWRVLNASADTYFDLGILFGSTIQDIHAPQIFELIAIDGVPVGTNDPKFTRRSHILLAPGARAEFIMKTPPVGTYAQLVTQSYDTGPDGETDPYRAIANIVSKRDARETSVRMPVAVAKPASTNLVGIPAKTVARERKLYFSEERVNPQDPASQISYFITVDGAQPKIFDMHATMPNITVQGGTAEEWTIENRAREAHAFHIHQLHFQLLERDGKLVNEPALRDTVDLPYWDGTSATYPSIKLRMDFRSPDIAGTFLYHCHLLEHEDGGMMGSIRVLPAH